MRPWPHLWSGSPADESTIRKMGEDSFSAVRQIQEGHRSGGSSAGFGLQLITREGLLVSCSTYSSTHE